MDLDVKQDPSASRLTDEGIIRIPGLLSRYVRLANGAKAHYVTSGETGPAVILLHGGIEGSSGTAGFRFMAPMLGAHGFRVYCPDRPGYGLADVSRPEYLRQDRKSNADFVTMFADALGIDKFHIGGNSSGGMICTDYMVHNPERLLSAALIATSVGDIAPEFHDGGMRPPTEGKFTPKPDYVPPHFDGTEDSMRELMTGIMNKPEAIWPELVTMRTRAAVRHREARKGESAGAARSRANADNNLKVVFTTKNRIDRLDIPVIHLWGLQDTFSPVENAFDQEDLVANMQFFYPDQCGHQGQTDQPDMINQVFLEFFRDGKISWETAKWAGVSRRTAVDPIVVDAPPGGFPPTVREAYSDYPTLQKALSA